MAEFPALPLWTDAYLADCSHLTDDEHGRYFLLLMAMWRHPDCRLVNDDAWLARRFRRTVEDIQAQFRPLIAEFCQSTGNWITQKRLTREYTYVRARHKNRSDAAKLRWEKEKDPYNAEAPTPTPTPTPTLSLAKAKGADTTFVNIVKEDPKKPVYDLGRKILGKAYGGQVTKLIRHCDGDLVRSLDVLQLAAGTADPPAYIGAVLKGDKQPDTDWNKFYAEMGVRL